MVNSAAGDGGVDGVFSVVEVVVVAEGVVVCFAIGVGALLSSAVSCEASNWINSLVNETGAK